MREVRHVFDRLPLLAQVLLGGLLCSALAALAGHQTLSLTGAAAGAAAGAGAGAGAAAGLAFGAGVLATLVAAGLAWRAGRAVDTVTQAARAVLRDETGTQVHMPQLEVSRELQQACLALRRLQDAMRQRLQALEARVSQLGNALRSRTQELSPLQDLSSGLVEQGDIGPLVNEALGALEQPMEFSSASVWARLDPEPRQPVALLGYRSHDSALGGVAPADLAGLRMSRADVARYEQIESGGQAIVENHPRQGLLSWLSALVTDAARTSCLYRGTRAWMAVPLQVRGTLLGVLRVDHGEPGHFDDQRVRLLSAVGNQTALAMRHAHLLARERDMAVVTERNRIARELHDAVCGTEGGTEGDIAHATDSGTGGGTDIQLDLSWEAR